MATTSVAPLTRIHRETIWSQAAAAAILVAFLIVAPFGLYPIFLMKALCFALFACAFNLLIGYGGLVSFGHALYFGWASYLCAYAAKSWGLTPELSLLIGTATAAGLGVIAGFHRNPPPGYLFCDDHARLGADDVSGRAAREIDRRRGRHSGGAARAFVRRARSQ